jgi:outer membrane lipoprotein-sorting protein
MRILSGLIACFLFVVCFTISINAEELMSDPYKILKKHYEATGGIEKLRAQKRIYAEGNFFIVGAELKGTLRRWTEKPLKMRQEVDLGIAKMVAGDNGEFSWSVDANGKILVQKDDKTLKEREVRGLMERYEHLNPESEYFVLSFQGTETIDGEECYVVTIKNDINETILRLYYNTANFYLMKEVSIGLDREEHTVYTDHRSVEGIVVPFCEVLESLPTGQEQRIEYTKYEFNPDIDYTIFEPPREDIVDYAFANGESAEGIKFEFIENHIYLPVVINGRERLWILDSGASVSVIDSAYAAEMGLEFKGPIKGQSASGIVELFYVAIPAFTLQGISFNEQQVMTMNISKLFEKVLGFEIAGILGYDFLSRFVTKIDYANEQVSFYTPGRFEYHGDGKVIDSPLGDDRLFAIPIVVDSEYSGKWHLDIGASGEDFHFEFANTHNLPEKEGIEAVAFGAAGALKTKRAQFKSIAIDGFTIDNPIIGIPYQEGRGSLGGQSIIGNVGNTFLRHFVLFLDYKNQQIILEKGDNYGKAFPRSKTGLQLWHGSSGDIEVFQVSPRTPADESGFQKGDIITAINGIDTAYFDGIIAIRKLFREKEGITYSFTISRGGKTMELPMTLRELY